MTTAAIATAATVAHFVLTLANAIRVRTLRGDVVSLDASAVVKYGDLADGSIGLRLADGRGVKVSASEWRAALASGVSVDGWLEAAYVLRVKASDDRGRRNAVLARLMVLGYSKPCGRCGGEGRYSYCRQYGSKCFDCGGAKRVPMRVTHDVLSDADNRVRAGELDAYLARLAEKSAARRAIKPLVKTITEEWQTGAVHTSYKSISRRDVPSDVIVESAEYRAADLINEAWDAAKDAERGVEFGKIDAVTAVTRLTECLEMVRAINAAWSEYQGEGRLTAPSSV